MNIVISNSAWVLGDGERTNFWNDKWLDKPLVELLNIPSSVQKSLKAYVHDFIKEEKWGLPTVICSNFPDISTAIYNVTIP